MTGIFLSYRRDDSQGEALHLFDDLKKLFGKDHVFMDVTGIDPGTDFRKSIDRAVSSCDVLIVMIGKKWLDGVDERGKRRLDDPNDFVRMETASALRRDIPVIPVLVQGAEMPRSENLPGELEALAWRNAFELRHARWEIDVAELMKALRKFASIGLVTETAEELSGLWHRKQSIALALAIAGVLFGAEVLYLWSTGRPEVHFDDRSSSSGRMSALEYGTNRYGGDYRSFESNEPQPCRDTCARESQCVAFTFVKPGVQQAAGICWLKDRVVPPNPDANCVSGIKE